MFDENFYYRLTGRLRSTAIFDRFDGSDSSVEAPFDFPVQQPNPLENHSDSAA